MWLSRSLNHNSKKIYYLLERFKTPDRVFKAEYSDFLAIKGLKPEVLKNMEIGRSLIEAWKKELESENIEFISFLDKRYPQRLRNLYIPPAGIYIKGRLPDEKDTLLSIIGSRRCSEYGKIVARKFSSELASKGIWIVSGMAAGIDSAGNRAAIEAGGRTIAVLGFGHRHCYPSGNEALMESIAKNGCLISEYPPDTRPEPFYFPQRNSIIAGISDGVLVVEAAKRSGALITADIAAECGRTVMAVPSNITNINGEGSNSLIKQGCCMVTEVEDILLELGIESVKRTADTALNKSRSNLTDEEERILKLINSEPVGFEYIINETGFEVQNLQSVLMLLEIKGLIEKLPGGRFMKK